MKKTFIIFFSVLYIVSTIGYASVHHYCYHEQKIISPCDGNCCPEIVPSSAPDTTENIPLAGTNTCCDLENNEISTPYVELHFSDHCCDIQQKYIQLDISFLPLVIDAGNVSPLSYKLFHDYPLQHQNINERGLISISDPSSHMNLPLLS